MTILTRKTSAKATILGVIAAACASVILTLGVSAQPAHASHYAAGAYDTGNTSLNTMSSLHKGVKFTVGGNQYKITDYDPYDDDRGEVVLVKYGSTKKAANINTVTYKGEVFDVEGIGKNAFNNPRGHAVTSITLGRNIDTILSKAFYGCAKVKTLNMAKADIIDIDRGPNGYFIDEVDIGSNAFKDAGVSKVKVKCGKSNTQYQALYKKALVKKGLRSDAVVIA